MYRYRVGVRNLGDSLGSFGSSGAKHACFLIDRALFEYDSNGYKRHINKGRDNDYDWDSIGNALNGTTYVSPDRLQKAIGQEENITFFLITAKISLDFVF